MTAAVVRWSERLRRPRPAARICRAAMTVDTSSMNLNTRQEQSMLLCVWGLGVVGCEGIKGAKEKSCWFVGEEGG